MALSCRSRLKSRVSPSLLPPSSTPSLAPFLFGSPLIPPRAQELPSQPSLPVSSGLCCLHPHPQEIPAESRRHNRSRFTLTQVAFLPGMHPTGIKCAKLNAGWEQPPQAESRLYRHNSQNEPGIVNHVFKQAAIQGFVPY